MAMKVKVSPPSSGHIRGIAGFVMIQVGVPNFGTGIFGAAPVPFLAVVTFGDAFGRISGKSSILSVISAFPRGLLFGSGSGGERVRSRASEDKAPGGCMVEPFASLSSLKCCIIWQTIIGVFIPRHGPTLEDDPREDSAAVESPAPQVSWFVSVC